MLQTQAAVHLDRVVPARFALNSFPSMQQRPVNSALPDEASNLLLISSSSLYLCPMQRLLYSNHHMASPEIFFSAAVHGSPLTLIFQQRRC